MYIEFESNQVIDQDFPNNKQPGSRWYTRSQASLMFKGASKYPDKFELNLSFSDNQNDQKSIGGYLEGLYFLSDDAFFLDSSNRNRPSCDYTKLVPVSHDLIQSRIKELQDLLKRYPKN